MSVFCCTLSGTFPIDSPFASVTSAIGAYCADASPGEDDGEATDALPVTLTKFIGRSVNKFEYGDGDLVFASGPARISVSDGFPTVDVSMTMINKLFKRTARTVCEPEYHCTATFNFGGQCLEHHGRSILFKTGCYDAQVNPLLLSLGLALPSHPANTHITSAGVCRLFQCVLRFP
jgi:hypothetical protein